MSLEQQLERLNTNLEALVGAIAANTSTVNNIAAIAGQSPAPERPQAADSPLADDGKNPRGAGRPKTVYYRLANGQVVKSSSKDAPTEGAVEITKAEYEAAVNNGGKTPADTKPQSSENPLSDSPAPKYTLDDVREIGLKYRDKTDQATAKAHVATFGVASLKDLPPEKFEEFITKTKALLEGDDEL